MSRTRRLIVRGFAFTTLLTLMAGCGGGDEGDSAGGSGGSAAGGSAATSDSDVAQAEGAVQAWIDSRFLRNNDGWTIEKAYEDHAGRLTGEQTQYRDLTFTIHAQSITDTDKLNDINWRGEAEFAATTMRQLDGDTWLSWSEIRGPTLTVHRKGAEWIIEPALNSAIMFEDGYKPAEVGKPNPGSR